MSQDQDQELIAKVIDEYRRLYKTYHELVGTMYPSVVFNKLVDMRRNLRDLGVPDHDIPGQGSITPPDDFGRAPTSL